MDDGKKMMIAMVYAKYSVVERLGFWDDIYAMWNSVSMPWLVSGDFNVIIRVEENIGGLPLYLKKCDDFIFCNNYVTYFILTHR